MTWPEESLVIKNETPHEMSFWKSTIYSRDGKFHISSQKNVEKGRKILNAPMDFHFAF